MRYSGVPVIGPSERLTSARLRGIGPTPLKEIKDTGVAITRGERFETTASVAAPAFGSDGEVVGAIAVIGPSERLSKNRLRDVVPFVLDEARVLTRRLSRGARA
jgi:DNA-binding IclR family transcriptional regulator